MAQFTTIHSEVRYHKAIQAPKVTLLALKLIRETIFT